MDNEIPGGPVVGASQANSAMPPGTPIPTGQSANADEANIVLPVGTPFEIPGGHAKAADEAVPDVPSGTSLDETIAAIRAWHRRRCHVMEQRKRNDLSLGSFLRSELGWSRALPKNERDRIKAKAKALIKLGEKAAKGKENDDPVYLELRDIISANLVARAPFDVIEKRAKEELEKLARTLPAWPWFRDNAFKSTSVSLAVIVSEAGDLSNYTTHSELWKRMGVAVIDGRRQGSPKNPESKQEWIEHGYNRVRRARLWSIGDSLFKLPGRYRDVYLARKIVEAAKAKSEGLEIRPAAKIPKGQQDAFRSLGHIDNRARRYMEKKLLRDLLKEWHKLGEAK